ncbi:MAG: phage baseplate assembly protein V [Gammaproteobacteria bacterium]|nr:phage baseplate assembly protein V [Gammaproteobacteria bacterium]
MNEPNTLELLQRIENILRPGVIAEVDHNAARARVNYGENPDGTPAASAWLPWFARAGNDSTWFPPEVGEQVFILSPGGELALGVILCGLYQDAKPAPSTGADIRLVKFSDGSFVEYDRAAHKMTASITGGDLVANATGNIVADAGGNIDATAGADINASATGAVNVTGAQINLNNGSPVVTCGNICAFLGTNHPHGSATVNAEA